MAQSKCISSWEEKHCHLISRIFIISKNALCTMKQNGKRRRDSLEAYFIILWWCGFLQMKTDRLFEYSQAPSNTVRYHLAVYSWAHFELIIDRGTSVLRVLFLMVKLSFFTKKKNPNKSSLNILGLNLKTPNDLINFAKKWNF